MKRIFLGVTGASGSLYACKILKELSNKDIQIHLCVTNDGLINLNLEMNRSYESAEEFLTDMDIGNTINYDYKDFAAPVSSGSNAMDFYLVVPASMGCIGRISSGASTNLVERCADVALKEKRNLLVLVREAPYNTIHLKNMLFLSELGVTVMPASPAFYHNPESVDEIINFVVGKIFDIMGIDHCLFKRWKKQQGEI